MQRELTIKNDLASALGAAGFHFRFVPFRVLDGMSRTLGQLREQGLVTESFYEEYGPYLEFSAPPEVDEPRTLIVTGHVSPPVKVLFHLDSGPLEAVIPPTYISSADRARCLEALRSVLGAGGYAVGRPRVPVKLLAVRAGLAQYGRNNLAYVTGLGSFVRLDAYCTDADLGAREHESEGSFVMSCCPPCRNCHHVCPTGCIPYDGTVIQAERCLTYFNEHEGEWPEWLDPRSHNSLVGCMRCQATCPANRYYLRKEEQVATFGKQETATILQNLPVEQLPEGLQAKLRGLDLEEYSTVLGRNLRALRDASK